MVDEYRPWTINPLTLNHELNTDADILDPDKLLRLKSDPEPELSASLLNICDKVIWDLQICDPILPKGAFISSACG